MCPTRRRPDPAAAVKVWRIRPVRLKTDLFVFRLDMEGGLVAEVSARRQKDWVWVSVPLTEDKVRYYPTAVASANNGKPLVFLWLQF